MAKYAKDAFNLFDKDRDGLVNTSSIGDLLRTIGFMLTQEQVQVISDNLKKKSFDLNEFLTIANGINAPICPEQEMIEYFRVFDKNSDGTVQVGELRHVMTSLGEKFSEEEIDELITEADEEGTGNINYTNFVKNMYALIGMGGGVSGKASKSSNNKGNNNNSNNNSNNNNNNNNSGGAARAPRKKSNELYGFGKGIGLTNEDVDKAVDAFYKADTDGNGTVDLEELNAILTELLSHKMKAALIKKIAAINFQEADKDNSGTIEIEEFLAIYSKIINQ